MTKLTQEQANNILNEICDIIWDDDLSDIEALNKIVMLLNKHEINSNNGDHTIH